MSGNRETIALHEAWWRRENKRPLVANFAPVSDGRFIYVSMGQGQTACLDLSGRIVWQTWFEQKDVSTHHVLSPLLADGVLVDMHGSGVLRGLDARTGAKVWEASAARSAKSTKSGYYVASRKVVRSGGTAYIVTPEAVWLCNRDAAAVDPGSGVPLSRGLGGEFRILAGPLLIWDGGGNHNALGSHWSVRQSDGKAVMAFNTADVSDPKAPKTLSARKVPGGENLPRHPLIESLLPTTWKQAQFVNAKGGRPGHPVHTDTSMMPSGNRLLIRTVSHLYGIGDPSVPFDGRRAVP